MQTYFGYFEYAWLHICWWNTNNNISFHYRLFPRKTNITKFIFQKIPKSLFWVHSGPFHPNWGQKWIFLGKKGPVSFSIFELPTIVPKIRKIQWAIPEKTVGVTHQKPVYFIKISLWDTANFRVLWLIEKPCNLIGQEHFGPYLRNQNFPKYEICSSIQELQ